MKSRQENNEQLDDVRKFRKELRVVGELLSLKQKKQIVRGKDDRRISK